MTSSLVEISVGARGSLLSKAQVDEVSQFFPHIKLSPVWIATKGDLDKTTSLKTLEKTDFFTDEIDARQLKGEFRISIHSAKDLPDPLHPDLEIIALTKGVDSSDSLVVREFPIRPGSRIGVSSKRRETFLKNWRRDLECVDIRGTVDERLKLLDEGFVDGVVMAEAALIRLGLTNRPRLHLDIDTAEMQGRLAIIARKGDHEMKQVFKKINYGASRILYLGTDPSRFGQDAVHCPLIETKPLSLPDSVRSDFDAFTHVILTSPNAARTLAPQMPLQHKKILAIGMGTADTLEQMGCRCFAVAAPETQEGMIGLLKKIPLENSYLFYPRSSSARPLLAAYLKEAGVKHQICDLYETVYLKPHLLPSLDDFDEIVFTSPSTIKAFLALYESVPKNIKTTCIGPITEQFFLRLNSETSYSFGQRRNL